MILRMSSLVALDSSARLVRAVMEEDPPLDERCEYRGCDEPSEVSSCKATSRFDAEGLIPDSDPSLSGLVMKLFE